MKSLKAAALSFCIAAGVLTMSSAARADGKPVLVAEVGGDVDAPSVREALAAELGADVVAPEDARAPSAEGVVRVEASGETKKLVVSYRKLNAEVTRAVALPDSPDGRVRAARFMVGNLARDEAKGALDALGPDEKPPAPARTRAAPAPSPSDPASSEGIARERLEKLIAYHADEERRARLVSAGVELGLGAAIITSGALLRADASSSAEDDQQRQYATGLMAYGTTVATLGFIDLLSRRNHEQLRDKVERENLSAAGIEKAWSEGADEARGARKTASTVSIVLGGVLVAAGSALPFLTRDKDLFTPMAVAVPGVLLVGVGVYGLASESSIEKSYRSYQLAKGGDATWVARPDPKAAASAPRVGIAPLPGGAMASIGMSF